MKYVRYLKGFDELEGYSSMNGLHIHYLGECRDRKLWLCFHLTNSTKNILAIEKQTPEGQDFGKYKVPPKTFVLRGTHLRDKY